MCKNTKQAFQAKQRERKPKLDGRNVKGVAIAGGGLLV
jgi:hypothetical protein